MKQINLRDFYPDIYKTDELLEVSDEIYSTLLTTMRAEAAYERQKYRYKAHYSLDCNDGIERNLLLDELTPEKILENKERNEMLYLALKKLSNKQVERLCAHYIFGVSKAEIARQEHVCESAIRDSINSALKHLFENLKNKL